MPIAATSSGGSSFLPLLFVIVIIVGMYFLMIRPQKRRNQALQEMQATLGPGAEVMTGSGIYGTVTDVDDEAGTVDLEVSEGVAITFARGAISKVITSAPADEYEDEEEDADSVDEDSDAEVDHHTDEVANQVIKRKD